METSAVVQTDEPRTTTMVKRVRGMPVYRQLVPLEAGIGWPLPKRRDGRVYATLPFYGIGVAKERGAGRPIFPPFASMTLDWKTGQIVSYRNLLYERPWPPPEGPVATFPHEEVAGLRRSEYLERRQELHRMYDELFETLQEGGSFTDAWLARFRELLQTMMEPSLKPFYRILAPKFVDRFFPADA